LDIHSWKLLANPQKEIVLSSIGGLLGTAGGAGGTGFASPQQAPIQTPVTTDQATDAYKANQTALTQQQSLLDAIRQQNGLQNQTNVYNQLQGIANGTGPNPAQAMLNQATGQNVANQAALMAGQRGSNANAGLLARQAAMQGANTQQQAAGQGATMQAQQSMNAINNMGALANTQAANQIGATGAVTSAQQAEQANLLNAIAGQNNARVGMQSNVNNINGQLANTQLQGQQAMLGGLAPSAGSIMSMFAEGGDVDESDSFGNFSSKVDAGSTPNVSTPTFGSDSGAAALSGKGGSSGGGKGIMALLADGGSITTTNAPNQPASSFGKFIKGVKTKQAAPESTPNYGNPGANALAQGMHQVSDQINQWAQKPKTQTPNTTQGNPYNLMARPDMAKGGAVPAMVSPGERYLSPNDVEKVKSGANPMQVGEKIPGKPKVGGAKNSYANDVVPKTLEEGGIVLPRSVTQAKHPHWAAHKFVQEVMRKKGKK
jgi:hypothetical protein